MVTQTTAAKRTYPAEGFWYYVFGVFEPITSKRENYSNIAPSALKSGN